MSATILWFALILALGASGRSAWAQADDALVAAARKEGTVNFYSALREFELTPQVRAFMERYPGVKVNLVRKSTGPMVQTVEAERMARRINADVIQPVDATPLYLWKQQGFLQPYRDESWNPFLEAFKDPDGYMIAGESIIYVIGYNTRLVSKDEVPNSWREFLTVKWKGKTVTSHPSFSGGALVNFLAMVNALGWESMKTLADMQNLFVQGHSDVARMVVSGERPLALISHNNVWDARKLGQSIDMVFQPEGVPVAGIFNAIPKEAPHPNAAKLFMRFLLSKPAQVVMAETGSYPGLPEVDPPKGMPKLATLKTTAPDYAWLVKNQRDFITRFDSYFKR